MRIFSRCKENNRIRRCCVVLFLLFSFFVARPVFAESADRYIVHLNSEPESAGVLRSVVNMLGLDGPAETALPETADLVPVSEEHGLYIVDNAATLRTLRRQGLVDYVEKDLEVVLFDDESLWDGETPAGGEFALLGSSEAATPDYWYLTEAAISTADSIRCDGRGIRIGLIDSGVSWHEALEGSIEPGYDFLSDSDDYTDYKGHGTFAAGIIAGHSSGAAIGCAAGAKIVPIKCFDRGRNTYTSTICAGIYAAVDQYDCDILNMSFGVGENSKALYEAISYAYGQGVVLVAAVGNDSGTGLQYPAAYEEVIGVGSIGRDNEHSSFSQYNSSVDLVAPGEQLWGLDLDNQYARKSGTSFAAPQVAAAAARLINALSDPQPAEVAAYLKAGAIDLGDPGRDAFYGEGKMSVENSIARFLSDCPVFLSPGETEGEETTFLILTSTGHAVDAEVVLITFDGSFYKDADSYEVSLGENESFVLHTSFVPPDAQVKCTVWDSHTSITPLSRFRYYGR